MPNSFYSTLQNRISAKFFYGVHFLRVLCFKTITMKKFIAFFYISYSLLSCTTETKEKLDSDQTDKKELEGDTPKLLEFNEAYSSFFWALVDKDEKTFNTFIHPQFGAYFIESNGALPSFVTVKDIANFKRITDGKSFFNIDIEKVGTEPLLEELPIVICEENIYNKQGCFTQNINKLRESGLWNIPDLKEQEKKNMDKLSETIEYTVVNTANYIYYFSQIDGAWYVTFIDMRTPCQA